MSVIIPTYNRAQMLRQAMTSVFAQTYRPIELIVVDDGSTDDTWHVVQQWLQRQKADTFTVRYLHQENQGAPTARNRGMEQARGEFIQFLDSDCFLAPEKISSHVQCLIEKPTAGFVYCRTAFVTPEGLLLREGGRPLHHDPLMNVADGLFTCIAPLWRHSTIQNIRWVEGLRCLQDWVFKAHVLITGSMGEYDAGSLCTAVLHQGDRISQHGALDFVHGRFQAVRIVEELIEAAPEPAHAARDILSQRYLSIFKSALRLRDYELARQALARATDMARRLHKVRWCDRLSRTLGLRLLRVALNASGRL